MTSINFTNNIGQVIKPGDKVISVGTSGDYISVQEGMYIGMSPRYPQVRTTYCGNKYIQTLRKGRVYKIA